MATDPETKRYQFDNFMDFLEGVRNANKSKTLAPTWNVDTRGRIRAVTSTGQVCCPITLVDLHVNGGEETPVERVNRVLKRKKPLLPPHLLEIISAAADNQHRVGPRGAMYPIFERDVQLEIDMAAGINGKRRHQTTQLVTPSMQQVA